VIVVDASAVLEILLNTKEADAVRRRLFRTGETLHAPYLLDVEVLQVLRRYALRAALDSDRGVEAVADFLALPIARYPHDILLDRIWELKDNMTAYDAAYVVLAELLRAPLVTRDARLARAARASTAIDCLVL
jgi:predicted nucleic acid-binding protein